MKPSNFLPTVLACAAVAASALAFAASAQPAQHSGMAHSANAHGGASPSPSTQAFQQSGEKMMQGMGQPYTGDADKDFVAQMVAHHEGAVDMAKIQLKYGKDPELKKLAGDIIKAQQQEIAFMKKWQARHGVKTGAK